MAHRTRQDYPTPSPSPSPPPTVKQEELPLSDSISSPHLESTRTLALTLPEPQTQAQLNKEDRRIPCEQCRKVRRACRWVKVESLERSSCERCRKTGKQCSGPTRRSQTILEIGQPLRQLQTRRQAVASIGPSSPESRWSTKHMSYSLTYHLVETGLEGFSYGTRFDAIDYPAFVSRFRLSQGRTDAFDNIDALFAQAQMIVGAHCSSHSALLRVSHSVLELDEVLLQPKNRPETTAIGLARQQPLFTLCSQLVSCVERLLSQAIESVKQASDKLAITFFALQFLPDSPDFAPERFRLLGAAVDHGVRYLRHSGPITDNQHPVQEPLRELAREEIRLSLILRQPTTLFPASHVLLFGDRSSPPLPPQITDFDYIFDTENIYPESFDKSMYFHDVWLPCYIARRRHIEYTLAYSPREAFDFMLPWCWTQLDNMSHLFNSIISKIIEDSRFDQVRFKARPVGALGNLFQDELEVFRVEWTCHLKAVSLDRTKHFQLDSKRRLFNKLNLESSRLSLLYQIVNRSFPIQSLGIAFVEAIGLCSAEILHEWKSLFPVDCERLIEGLRPLSYGSPEACRLILILEPSRSVRA